MALPEHKANGPSSITTLKSHDLLHIFGYLDYRDLLHCRLVCPHWYHIIKHEVRLIDRFRFGLTLDSGTVICSDEPPFSIIEESKIKIKRITVKEDFLEPGNSIAVVEANRVKLLALFEHLTNAKAANTVTEMIVHAKDNEPRTNAFLFQMIMEMKSLQVLRFTLTAFVYSLETLCSTPDSERCQSLEHVQIMHTDCKRLILPDFTRLLQIFPNIKRIDVTPYDAMLLGEDILRDLAHLIKSIEGLESYTLIELLDIQNMSLRHIAYECCADDLDDVASLYDFLHLHSEVETLNLKLVNCSSDFFSQPLNQLTDLALIIKRSPVPDDAMVESTKLSNILKWTPNLKTFSVRCKGDHPFGHQVVQLKNLLDVTMTRFCFDCETCVTTTLKSIANVTTLKFKRHGEISVKQLSLISTHLQQLQCLELMFEDSVELENHFARWPAMPKLKTLVVNRVGHLTNKGITNLQKNCPMLETIKFYSLRGGNINALLKLLFQSFPNLGAVTFRGGRCLNIPHLNYIDGKVGWRLKELDVSAYIQPSAIIKLFKNNNFLETVRCKYGALVVTRRIYYEVELLKAYTLESIEQPLKNRKRLHMYDDMSSDSETSNSEESSSGSGYETYDEDDDDDD